MEAAECADEERLGWACQRTSCLLQLVTLDSTTWIITRLQFIKPRAQGQQRSTPNPHKPSIRLDLLPVCREKQPPDPTSRKIEHIRALKQQIPTLSGTTVGDIIPASKKNKEMKRS